MRKLIVRIFLVLLMILVADLLVGFVATKVVSSNILGGVNKKIHYIQHDCKEDMVFIGPSIVENSFVPSILSDSLHVSCFNAGLDGQGFASYLDVLEMVTTNSKVKYIVLGLRPNELSNDVSYFGRYERFAPYYHTGVNSINENLSLFMGYKVYSNLLRYNTVIWRIFLSTLTRKGGEVTDGVKYKSTPVVFPKLKKKEYSKEINSNSAEGLKTIIKVCKMKEIRLFVVLPPQLCDFQIQENSSFTGKRAIERICQESDVTYLDYSWDDYYINRPELFHDNVHLNSKGAKCFSYEFASKLKSLL